MEQKNTINYLNNDELINDFKNWDKEKNPTIPNIIAKKIILICENLARSGRFKGYTWKNDMIDDAILACLKACKNVNLDKSTNIFSYFTMVAWHAFQKSIKENNARIRQLNDYKENLYTIFNKG